MKLRWEKKERGEWIFLVKVEKNDFVLLSFEARSGDRVLEKTGKPVLAIAGSGRLVKALDDVLVGSEVGVQLKADAGKAFGERKSDLVKLIPLQRFREQGIDPVVGMVVELDGVPARVQSASGGRVRVDFNHELAGLDVGYSFKVEKAFKTLGEKTEAVFSQVLPGVSHSVENGVVKASASTKALMTQGFLQAKARALEFLLSDASGAKKVVFEEEFEKPALN